MRFLFVAALAVAGWLHPAGVSAQDALPEQTEPEQAGPDTTEPDTAGPEQNESGTSESATVLGTPPSSDGRPPITSSEAPEDEGAMDQVPPPPVDEGYGRAGRYPSGFGAPLGDHADLRIPSRTATKLRVLDADLTYLAARGGSIVDGILSIVTGGLSITLGFLIDNEVRNFLFVYGSAGVARGVLDIILDPNVSSAAIEFNHMPMGTLAEVEARVRFGEQELESIASRSQLARILDASINIAAGLAIVPIYIGPTGFDEIDPFGYIVLVLAGVSVVTGIINLFMRTEAERRWSAYETLVERLDATADRANDDDRADDDRGDDGAGDDESFEEDSFEEEREAAELRTDGGWNLHAGPLPSGGILGVSATF
jgi:hypothetical protein